MSVGSIEDPHRLFPEGPAASQRVLPRLLYRLPRRANGHRIRTAAALRSFGCWTIVPGNRNSADFDTAEETVAEMADDPRCRFGSFGWDEWPDDVDPRAAFAEWRVIGGEGVFDGSHALAKLGLRLPIDVASPRRLRQRVTLLKDSLPHIARVGLAVNLESAEANADVLAELPIEFLTIICPASVLLDQHPAMPLVDRGAEAAIRRYRGRGGPRIVCQPPLRSGYDAAYYLAAGADAVVVNGLPMLRAGGLRVEPGPRLFDVTVDFVAGKDELRPAAGPLERFIAEVADGARYYGVEL